MKMRTIVRIICEEFELTQLQLISTSRERWLTYPRMMVYELAMEFTYLNTAQVAMYVKRDTKTVTSGIMRICKIMAAQPKWRRAFNRCHERLKEIDEHETRKKSELARARDRASEREQDRSEG